MTKKETIYQLEAVRDSCRARGNDFDADVLNHCIDSVKTFREPKANNFCEQQPPLTMAELRNMNDEIVYCLELNIEVRVSARKTGWIYLHYPVGRESDCCAAKDVTLYRTRLKEELYGHWIYWDGWCGNHDRRIDDATCSVCGYRHPTVRATKEEWDTPKFLSDTCPGCGAKMKKGENHGK